MRNQVNCENFRLKRDYFAKKISDNDKDINGIWNTINKLVNRRSKTTAIPFLEVEGKIMSENESNGEAVNNYFATIGSNLNSMFRDYSGGSEPTVPELNTATRFRFKNISENAVLRAISRLKSKRSFGYDGISKLYT